MFTKKIFFLASIWTLVTAGLQEAPAVSYSYISRPTDHIQHTISQPVIKKTISPIIYSAPIQKPSVITHLPSVIHHQTPIQIYKPHEPSLISKVALPPIYTQQFHVPTVRKEINVSPIHIPAIHKTIQIEKEHHAPAFYEFGYSVEDHHTGDIKKQQEVRKDHVVEGSYSLIDPDGFKRVVQYSADDHRGFVALVHREPIGKVVTKVAAPSVVKYATPSLVKVPYY